MSDLLLTPCEQWQAVQIVTGHESDSGSPDASSQVPGLATELESLTGNPPMVSRGEGGFTSWGPVTESVGQHHTASE